MVGVRPRALPRRAAGGGCRMALWAMAVALIGCQSGSPRSTTLPRPAAAPDPNPGAPPGAAPHDEGSYDWHGLLIAPFGTVLKAIPLTLHEVLLFRDDTPGSGSDDAAAGAPAPGAADCYAADTPAPPFAGRTPEAYVLCFTHDRLARMQVSVRLTTAEAPGVFAAACAAWLNEATPAAAAPATGVPAPEIAAAEASAVGCTGRNGAIRFSGRLEQAADRPEMPSAELMMSITLESDSAP